jgi:hypothetical protein
MGEEADIEIGGAYKGSEDAELEDSVELEEVKLEASDEV